LWIIHRTELVGYDAMALAQWLIAALSVAAGADAEYAPVATVYRNHRARSTLRLIN